MGEADKWTYLTEVSQSNVRRSLVAYTRGPWLELKCTKAYENHKLKVSKNP